MQHDRSPVRRTVPAAALVAGAAVLALSGCGTTATPTARTSTVASAAASPASSAPVVQGRIGTLTISDGYVPVPASPDVAAAYLTVTNTGSGTDAVVAAASDAGGTTTLHRTAGDSMVPLDRLVVPAHGHAAFAPGGDHLMIEQPTRPLTLGGVVRLTLTFEHAGTVTVAVPVTPYRTGGPDGSMGSMSPMPGMS